MTEYAAPPMTGKNWAPMNFPEGPFHEAVRELRTKAGLTQVGAAQVLGIQPSTLSKWERKAQVPHPMMQEGTVATLRKLAGRKPKPQA